MPMHNIHLDKIEIHYRHHPPAAQTIDISFFSFTTTPHNHRQSIATNRTTMVNGRQVVPFWGIWHILCFFEYQYSIVLPQKPGQHIYISLSCQVLFSFPARCAQLGIVGERLLPLVFIHSTPDQYAYRQPKAYKVIRISAPSKTPIIQKVNKRNEWSRC